jgi:hypothetical protein
MFLQNELGLLTKVLRGMQNQEYSDLKYWRKQYNKELMQLLGDLEILSFVRVSQSNCTGHVNRMDCKRRTASQVFNNNPQGSRLEDDQKPDGGSVSNKY